MDDNFMDDDDSEEIIEEEELVADYLFGDPFTIPISSDESNAPNENEMADASASTAETTYDFTAEQLKLLNDFNQSAHVQVIILIFFLRWI
jgi:hypothetical protein